MTDINYVLGTKTFSRQFQDKAVWTLENKSTSLVGI